MKFVPSYKISVYVPEVALLDFIAAISPHIPAFLGEYEYVCYWSAGVEQSRQKGHEKVVQVPSFCVEISMPHDLRMVEGFISSYIIRNHPWDEPVITIAEQHIVDHHTRVNTE